MKEKILAAIKAKFSTAKLSAKRLDALAATIEAKVGTDETLIDTTLDALNEIYPLADIAKDDHIRSTLEGKLKATQTKKQDDSTDSAASTTTDIPDDTPTWAKALIESNKTLSSKLAAIESEKNQSTMKQKATTLLKDIPASYWNRWQLPEKDEDLETFVEGVKTDYTAFTKDLTDKGIAVIPQPASGGTTTPKPEEVSTDMKQYLESKKAQNGKS